MYSLALFRGLLEIKACGSGDGLWTTAALRAKHGTKRSDRGNKITETETPRRQQQIQSSADATAFTAVVSMLKRPAAKNTAKCFIGLSEPERRCDGRGVT